MGVLTLWWVWGAAALVLAIIEVLVPGFIFLGFAIGALGLALLLLLGAGLSPMPLLAVFGGLSLIAWIVLRALFRGPAGQIKTFERDIND